jgi:serine/threonine protein kinase
MADLSALESIYFAALEKPPAERPAFLDAACGGNAELRASVERLLAAEPEVGGSLSAPSGPVGTDATGTFASDAPTAAGPTLAHSGRDEHAGAVIAGRYTLVEVVGEGGMGSVWRAKQTEPLKRFVAVKLIKAGMDSKQVLARFEAERQALALMDHPNIARVLDGGIHDGRPFFVMELVKGVPITDFCDARRLTPRERLELFVPVCQAIQHAHQKGLIHRDIKPSNVLVALYDDRPVIKVIDFGVAKATGGALTERTIDTGFAGVVGTPQYMSPEQATLNNLDIDTRSDVYALGVLLYELLTGSPPFARKELEKRGLLEVLRVVREEEPPRPSTKLSTADALPTLSANRGTEPRRLTALLRGELDWIVMKALEKDRSRRYEMATGLAADVQRYLAGEPVLAHPPSTAYRLRKFVRRHRGPVLAASVVLLALLAGIAGTTFGLVRAEERRREAEKAAAAEKAAKEQTQKRLAQIEKGVELFAGMLTGIDPRAEVQGGDPIYAQLRQRAEQAADALDAEAVGDALAVARLQSILGNTLRELGSYAKAVEVLGKARAIRERELGADDTDTLTTLHDLALVYLAIGKLPEAIALFEQARDGFVEKLGADSPDTLNSLNSLANAYRVAGRLPVAIALFEQVRDAQVRTLGADHLSTLNTLDSLAFAYQAAAKLPEAIALHEQVRDARVRTQGADHLSTLTSLNNLADAYRLARRLPEAVPLFEQVRDGFVKKLGAEHPSTLVALNNLGSAYQGTGRLPEATALFEQAATGIAKLRFEHENAGQIISNAIATYERAGRLDKAEGWRRQWLPVIKRRAGADSPAYAGELAGLGLNLLQQEKWADAEPILREGLALREKTQPDAWTTFQTQSLLGGALLGQKKYADAEPRLLAGYEGMKAREETIPPQAGTRIPEALDRLIGLYTATDKPEEVTKWRAERARHATVAPPREKK